MKKAKTTAPGQTDPCPYDGPIARADGQRPWNRFLWPTEDWWANRSLSRHYHSRWHFDIVALADGRWCTDGEVYAIERDRNCYERRCNFPTRAEAIRAAAARMIRQARASRHWENGSMLGAVQGKALADLINWARGIVAGETNKPEPKPVTVLEPPIPPAPRITDGLELFDRAEGAA